MQVDTPKLRDLVAEIAWAKVSNVNPEDYSALAAATLAARLLRPGDGRAGLRGIRAGQADRSRIDFEDILLCTAALLSEHPEVADTIRRTYRHLVVDEYQDVSPLQEALLNLWRGDRTDLCVVGDPAQTIHSFAGARAHFLTGFARRFPGTTVIRLVRDYRSTPQVVGCANAIMAAGPGAVTLQAQQPAGPEVQFAEAPDEAAEAAGIADWLTRQAAAAWLSRDGRAVPDQRPIAAARAGAGRPRHSLPGARRRAVLRAARGPPGAADAAHRGPGPEGFDQPGRSESGSGECARAVQGVARRAGLVAAAARWGRCRTRTLGIAGCAVQRRRGPAGRRRSGRRR